MGRFDEKLRQAEQNIINSKIDKWRDEQAKKLRQTKKLSYQQSIEEAEKMKIPEISLKYGTLTIEFENGYLIFDTEEFMKLPKMQKSKILKNGGK